MRPTTRDQIVRRLFQLGMFNRIAKWNRKKVLILQYHGVTRGAAVDDGAGRRWQKHVNAQKFLEQMRYLAATHTVVPLEDVVSHYARGTRLPASPAAITMDDGYANNYSEAYPILTALGLPATIFVTTDFVSAKQFLWTDRIEYALRKTCRTRLDLELESERIALSLDSDSQRLEALNLLRVRLKRSPQNLRFGVVRQVEEHAGRALGDRADEIGDYASLTWQQIVEMEGSQLITIGGHTVTHPILTHCFPDEVETELRLSKTVIEEVLGRRCQLFCYPNGDFDSATKAAVESAGYTGATSSLRGLNNDDANVFALKRIGVSGTFPLSEFAARTSGGEALLSRARSLLSLRRLRRGKIVDEGRQKIAVTQRR